MSTQQVPRTTPGLLGYCPSWCVGGHEQAVEEGCDVESARVHISDDVGGLIPDIVNHSAQRLDRPGGGGWQVELHADPGPEPHGYGYGFPTIELRLHEWTKGTADERRCRFLEVSLTSGEARTLARQLTHYADLVDLPDVV